MALPGADVWWQSRPSKFPTLTAIPALRVGRMLSVDPHRPTTESDRSGLLAYERRSLDGIPTHAVGRQRAALELTESSSMFVTRCLRAEPGAGQGLECFAI